MPHPLDEIERDGGGEDQREAGGGHPHVLVTVDQHTLGTTGHTGQPGGSPGATLSWVGPITGSTARRIACDAQYTRVVIGPDGRLTHDTDYPRTPDVSLADRAYFKLHQADPALDSAVASLRAEGIPVIVSAGNVEVNACRVSPGNADGAVVVGAVVENTHLENDDVRNVRVLERFSFVEVPEPRASEVAGKVNGTRVRGTELRVEVTTRR